MAYQPGSLGRTMQGELFIVDDTGVAHNEGTDEFASLWRIFMEKKRSVLVKLFDIVHANYWDLTYRQMLWGRPILLESASDVCLLMYRQVLHQLYRYTEYSKRQKIKDVRDYILTWGARYKELHPTEIWIVDLIEFVSSDVIYSGVK